MNITGTQMIFAKPHEGADGTWYSYSTAVSKKNTDGTWESDFYEVVFVKEAKGTVLEDKTKINITGGFLSFRTYGDKKIKQIVVTAFEKVDAPPVTRAGGFTALSESDVPF